MIKHRGLISFLLILFCCSANSNEFNGLLQVGLSYSDTDKPWLVSWLRNGTGVTRFDSENDGLDINLLALEYTTDFSDSTSIQLSGIYYPDGEERFGITEAFVDINPIAEGWKNSGRIGLFYPSFSFENPDTAWNSPYTYSFSAINTWVAEELRILGGEWSLTRPGKAFRSPHTFKFVASLYTANDPIGTILSWRGWGLSQRQTFWGERVEFADYPSLDTVLSFQPPWVEPFEEIDDNIGYYVGTHWRYKTNSELRVYFYDNNADETERISPQGQYAWETNFVSIAWQYRFNKHTRILTQYMNGETVMGWSETGDDYVVQAPFNAFYLLASHKQGEHRFSIRYDKFKVEDEDAYPLSDPNNSDGDAWTINWRYNLTAQTQFGIESLWVDSTNQSRTLWNWPAREKQHQMQAILQYRF
ncbi:hypothetical protein FLL45_19345 [Aliikangiella marina]|uniref:Porin n=1 Tax=Aliikangiella marina TaxID=1712262 RepID=A0A545T546_9GAMM|nr:hypothetical protein [Aliikangiella marina]TQV72370.1 hypothetical protein FLL45_19345 [Aliikangiella marina]